MVSCSIEKGAKLKRALSRGTGFGSGRKVPEFVKGFGDFYQCKVKECVVNGIKTA